MRGTLQVLLGMVMITGLAYTAGAETEAEAEEVLTVITSEKLTFDYQKKYAFFEKDVVVVDPGMKIFADTLMVTFDDDSKAQDIKAQGNVRILQEDKQARAKVAEYVVESGKIILRGDPQVTRGKDTLTADTITFWRDQNRMICEPQARFLFYREEGDEKGGFLGGFPGDQ